MSRSRSMARNASSAEMASATASLFRTVTAASRTRASRYRSQPLSKSVSRNCRSISHEFASCSGAAYSSACDSCSISRRMRSNGSWVHTAKCSSDARCSNAAIRCAILPASRRRIVAKYCGDLSGRTALTSTPGWKVTLLRGAPWSIGTAISCVPSSTRPPSSCSSWDTGVADVVSAAARDNSANIAPIANIVPGGINGCLPTISPLALAASTAAFEHTHPSPPQRSLALL